MLPASLGAPVSSGLDDLFDLGGGVGMPTGGFVPPKTVSSLQFVIHLSKGSIFRHFEEDIYWSAALGIDLRFIECYGQYLTS